MSRKGPMEQTLVRDSARIRHLLAVPAARTGRGPRSARRGSGAVRLAGLTLVELVLTLVLLSMLLGLVVINVAGWHESRKLQEGALQVEVLLRLARAESASLGRKFRLAIEEETHNLQVQWEAEPLTAPGEFTPYSIPVWSRSLPNELVWVQKMQLTGASAFRTLIMDETRDAAEREAQQALAPVTFYPDGSSDSAHLELIARSGQDQQEEATDPDARLAVIELDGTNGLIRTQLLTLEELEEIQAAKENPPPPTPAGYAEDCEECDR